MKNETNSPESTPIKQKLHEETALIAWKELQRFFEDYKKLEHKEVVIDNLRGRLDAINTIKEAIEFYNKKIRN